MKIEPNQPSDLWITLLIPGADQLSRPGFDALCNHMLMSAGTWFRGALSKIQAPVGVKKTIQE